MHGLEVNIVCISGVWEYPVGISLYFGRSVGVVRCNDTDETSSYVAFEVKKISSRSIYDALSCPL
jgi:hypothetical protein